MCKPTLDINKYTDHNLLIIYGTRYLDKQTKANRQLLNNVMATRGYKIIQVGALTLHATKDGNKMVYFNDKGFYSKKTI